MWIKLPIKWILLKVTIHLMKLFMKFCGPLDNSDPCRGENVATSLVYVDHYIERAKEEDNLLAAYRWLMFKSLMSKVFGKTCFVFHLI